MNSNPHRIQWKEIADMLRELNLDFDRRVAPLFPARPRRFPSPPARPTPGSGMGMTMNTEQTPRVPPFIPMDRKTT